uniref:glutaredoxin-dependent peroxiredoxin n=1 Tax=Pyramimonas obovata TaxID=1411642 RepID=A0A7S0RLU4_9CHLO|mmetsp:Transcript_37333/g.81320  ORF Transcript_37333/g.81320 Transcript_37333/m.81320 type:complete len:214 (+) Transcript_37333:60-701(+)|eukprot:CAMPEP_0118924078 /NCGR_PEP_ID=MMETSP1169-20130426/2377_1 /TAXON_ID=36882 /ORGANISM="Pyramimonas obovata, Strain CCMP722" /LENGTH=213 /DNA_ID=CAMNT_0006865159 /DNA_START=57 /DNA_END=698 /DNA_ORIENTATION=+
MASTLSMASSARVSMRGTALRAKTSLVARAPLRAHRLTTRAAVKVGDEAPDFSLTGPAGDFASVSLPKSGKAVLAFFPAAFSGDADGGCECQLNQLASVKAAGVPVIGISKDSPFTMAKWAAATGDLTYVCDSDNAISEEYVGTFDLGAFLNNLGISKGFKYVCPNRGCVVVEDGKVVYTWIGQDETGPRPDLLPPIDEIMAAAGVSVEKKNF